MVFQMADGEGRHRARHRQGVVHQGPGREMHGLVVDEPLAEGLADAPI